LNESIKNRAAAIRDYVSKFHSPDPNDLYKFPIALATWDALRLQIDKGPATVDDDRRLADLTSLCENLSEKVGLGRTLTSAGFLVGSASDRIISKSWQEAAEGW
jgi:hypothetical protein